MTTLFSAAKCPALGPRPPPPDSSALRYKENDLNMAGKKKSSRKHMSNASLEVELAPNYQNLPSVWSWENTGIWFSGSVSVCVRCEISAAWQSCVLAGKGQMEAKASLGLWLCKCHSMLLLNPDKPMAAAPCWPHCLGEVSLLSSMLVSPSPRCQHSLLCPRRCWKTKNWAQLFNYC